MLLRLSFLVYILLLFSFCGNPSVSKKGRPSSEAIVVDQEDPADHDASQTVFGVCVSPKNPKPGETFHVLVTGSKNLRKAKLFISTPKGNIEST